MASCTAARAAPLGLWLVLGVAAVLTLPQVHAESEADLTKITSKVFFDIQIDGKPEPKAGLSLDFLGRLFPRQELQSTEYRLLIMSNGNGEKGIGKFAVPLWYKGSTFHRIIPGFMIQGGDFVNHNGMGCDTIWGPDVFPDENFKLNHAEPGTISMANYGKDSNGCQFAIITVEGSKLPKKLDGVHVVFGKVLTGMDLVHKIEAQGQPSGVPKAKVLIADSGELPGSDEL